MSYDNWWEDTDEDFKRKLIDQELEDAGMQDNPIATEGWGVFLANKLAKIGISFPEKKLTKRALEKLDSVFKDPRIVQWVDIQAKLIMKQAAPYAKANINPSIKLSFATRADLEKLYDNPNNGILNYDGNTKPTSKSDYDKVYVYDFQCGKYMLEANADSNSIKRVFVWLKTSEDALALAALKAPDDQELLKIVGAIEAAEIVDEGLISKIKSFVSGRKDIKKVKPKREPQATINIAKAALKKALAMDEFKVIKKYIKFQNEKYNEEEFKKYGNRIGILEFKYDLPNEYQSYETEDQEDMFLRIWNKFIEKVNEIIDDPAYEVYGEGKLKDTLIFVAYNDKVAIIDKEVEEAFNKFLSIKEEPLTEAYVPATEGTGMRLASKVSAAGWGTAILAALASLSTFGYALFYKGTWAALLGGAAVGSVASSISGKLRDKANKYIEAALASPEMAAYIRAKAKEVVNDIKKQASSMKDGKYVINTNIQPDDLPSDIFHQPFKAPGEETDDRIEGAKRAEAPFSGYEYAEKKVGEYTIAVFYDTNSIKGIYVVVEIKDLADKFGSSWIRVRPIPSPSKEDLKKMNLK